MKNGNAVNYGDWKNFPYLNNFAQQKEEEEEEKKYG